MTTTYGKGKHKNGHMVYLSEEELLMLAKLKVELTQPGVPVSVSSIFRMALYNLVNTRKEQRNAPKG